ncbi:amino acid ABC transporter permease [Nakamurella leprariae]|uniref:Amino acid ABC transporter permease n=1 Tax=Nakamurella leprariae TaxID=2803911 RepID=A0A939C0W7_9ACTN|nr:amino acid ABC transporter permease [Nakamurella leprariae]MBM9469211.1 amino acid ABC transporter permease [Nakamurella leprariae]
MSGNATVLYDHPGPRAKARNLVLSVLFGILLVLGVWWVVDTLIDKQQLTAAKWSPIVDWQNWETYLLPGLWNTLKAAFLALIIALPLGALFGIARLSDHAWVRWPSGIIVEFFRAVPVLILMLFAFQFWFLVTGVSSPLAGVVIGLVLYNGSVLAEVFRAGILALPKGQTEAAQAIGLSKSQTMLSVLLPQAVTSMLPAVVSQLVVIVKDTALGGLLIGYVELRRTANTMGSFYGNLLATYTVVAVIFILVNLALSWGAGALERTLRNRRGGRTATVLLSGLEGPMAGGARNAAVLPDPNAPGMEPEQRR